MKQQLLLELSQGFSILPLYELSADNDLKIFPLGKNFTETLQIMYNPNEANANVFKFIDYIKNIL